VAISVGSVTPEGRVSSGLRLTVTRDEGTTEATCVLIARDEQVKGSVGATETVLYFLTAGRPFRRADGERLPHASAITITLEPGHTVDVKPDALSLPAGTSVDIAILRAVVQETSLTPAPLAFHEPAAGSIFTVSGWNSTEAPTAVTQRVTRRSTLLLIGDGDLSSLMGCVGAPAIAEYGVFGIVTQCEAGRPPVVSLLAAARRWIDAHVPGRTAKLTA
jgi:hypothetical protein